MAVVGCRLAGAAQHTLFDNLSDIVTFWFNISRTCAGTMSLQSCFNAHAVALDAGRWPCALLCRKSSRVFLPTGQCHIRHQDWHMIQPRSALISALLEERLQHAT
jgi:hypothetical protein